MRKVPEEINLAIFPVLLEGLRSSSSDDLQARMFTALLVYEAFSY